jgi:hypothetical protein
MQHTPGTSWADLPALAGLENISKLVRNKVYLSLTSEKYGIEDDHI